MITKLKPLREILKDNTPIYRYKSGMIEIYLREGEKLFYINYFPLLGILSYDVITASFVLKITEINIII